MDLRTEIREFLSSRRSRISPEQAGLPAYGGNRRVKGLRREEVAMLAGVSVDYYVRMERGSLAGASEGVLDALASALQLDEAERDHLLASIHRGTVVMGVGLVDLDCSGCGRGMAAGLSSFSCVLRSGLFGGWSGGCRLWWAVSDGVVPQRKPGLRPGPMAG